MRLMSSIWLFAAAASLSACGGTAESTLNLTGDQKVCGLACPVVQIDNNDRDGTSNTGNDTNISASSGDTTIVLESSTIVNVSESDPAYSKLSRNSKIATFEVDPNIKEQANWPKTKEFEIYKSQGQALDGPGSYKEYRVLTRSSAGTAVDEELQVWKWDHSYGVQYRNVSNGGEATHQAYSFGGVRTKTVPTSGSATYNGRFGTTAKAWNWIDPSDGAAGADATLSRNGLFRVNGRSQTNVNFGTGSVTATLTPEKWTGFQTRNGATGFTSFRVGDGSENDSSLSRVFADSKIKIAGTLTKTSKGNAIKGRAKMDPSEGWVSDKTGSPFHGALFGSTAQELTGIFNVEAINPEPTGQDSPINDDRRGFLNHSGVLNGKK